MRKITGDCPLDPSVCSKMNRMANKSAENVSFPEENLQVTENGVTFVPIVDEYDPAGKGRYVSPMVDYGFKNAIAMKKNEASVDFIVEHL